MPTVDFMTCCYWKDSPKIHADGILKKIVDGHNYPFNKVILIHQKCKEVQGLREITEVPNLEIHDTSDHPNILTEFKIPEHDADADLWTHGPQSPHYWKHHVINHLTAMKVTKADYIVCSDSDITVIKNDSPGWINKGLEILQKYREVFMVSCDEGGKEADRRIPEGRLVRTVSQQLFLVDVKRFREANLAVPYDATALYEDPKKRTSNKLAPYGPMQEFYFMLEGRIWRWIDSQGLYRCMLPANWRYWHWQGKCGGE
jgi:hypothetical protein